MVRRCWALVLSVVLLLGVLPMVSEAATEDPVVQIRNSTRRSYTSSRAAAGVSSFNGLCGKMVAYQLRYLGITRSAEIVNGNQMYDRYSEMDMTSGGYYISAYSAQDYSLEQALNEITHYGTQDAYNILVGFQSTNTAAGRRFGHTCLINGIVDGTVYFVEGFNTSLGGPEGSVIQCSIGEFVNLYSDWTVYEGCIRFCENYAQTLEGYGTDVFVRSRFEMTMRSQPCLVGQQGCRVLRTVSAGERLRVNRVLRNEEGEFYYQILDGENTGYILAKTATLERTNAEELSLQGLRMPVSVQSGESLSLEGTVSAQYGLVGEIEAVITDGHGKVVLRHRQVVDQPVFSLDQLEALVLPELEDGAYELTLTADTASAYIMEERLDYSYATAQLAKQTFWVGAAPRTELPHFRQIVREKKDGWVWQDDTWYYYNEGKPCTGWVRNMGVEYYIGKDGAVTTGWTEVDGKLCYFSATGALCTGWLSAPEGMRYCFEDGTFANGWQTIGTSLYYFDEGLLQVEGSRDNGDVRYTFQPDGKAVVVDE